MAKKDFACGNVLIKYTKEVLFSSITSMHQLKQRYKAEMFRIFVILWAEQCLT